ncbi:MAG: Gfo/Idh/MocA family oxidoreductase [Defluviitaleaceae bacterium]|nr:Gfo/Idh/MocA family oxidoreductase [Defluviitaleaceae bacterium]
MSGCVNVGIIGIGSMGGTHAERLYNGSVSGLRLVSVCDVDRSRLDRAKELYPGIKIYTDCADLVGDKHVDAVIIAAPHYFHPPAAELAFAAGLHVLSEKPAGVYAAQVQGMIGAAKKAGTVFCVMHNQRTDPIFKRMREMVKDGSLGELKRLNWIITNWYRTQAYYDSGGWRASWAGEGGGVLINQAYHNIDLWQWIFGMPQSIAAFCKTGRYHDIETEDEAVIYAEYNKNGKDGPTAIFIASTGEYPGDNRLEITGDRGKLVAENGRLKFWKLSEPEREVTRSSKEAFDCIPTEETDVTPNETETDGHLAILQNFSDAILHGAELISPGAEAINGVQIFNAAYMSSWSGRHVSLPVDPEQYKAALDEKIKNSKKTAAVGEAVASEGKGRWNVRW